MKVFFDERQNVPVNTSFSPSAGKPARIVAGWKEMNLPIEIMEVVPCSIEDLYLAHSSQHVNEILACQKPNGFDNKLQTVADSLVWTNGSFVSAAEYAFKTKESVVSPTSGFHHAGYSTSEGFCTFNGLMVAAIKLKNNGANRIAILDIDMHYGNGTDDIIERLGINYINHYTFGGDLYDDGNFIKNFPGIVDRTIKGCDIIFYQAGADPHVDDPYGGSLTTEELRQRDFIVFDKAKKLGIPVVWNLAGGYQSDFSKIAEIHNNTALEHLKVYGVS
jgi:acetoin utilization deacetylase AcuC-like enzyme